MTLISLVRMGVVFMFAFSAIQLLAPDVFMIAMLSLMLGTMVAHTIHQEYAHATDKLILALLEKLPDEEHIMTTRAGRSNKR